MHKFTIVLAFFVVGVLLVSLVGSADARGNGRAKIIVTPKPIIIPFSNGMGASVVLGQSSFTTSNAATSQNGFDFPAGITFDPSGNVWVSEFQNNRVLEFKPPFSNGMVASLVIGQPAFNTGTSDIGKNWLQIPSLLAFDPSGNLWVPDEANNRVLEFKPPFSNGMNASLVIGQRDFNTGTSDTTQSTLFNPVAVAFDHSGNLWVSDKGNNRVLEFKPPFSNGMVASLVLGHSRFNAGSAGLSQNKLSQPAGLTFDSFGNLWVTDDGNNRVLEFSFPFRNGMKAFLVIGQPDFTTSNAVTSQNGLSSPLDVAFDPLGHLWIADDGNQRVLEYTSLFSNGMRASLVVGNLNFTTISTGPTQKFITSAESIEFDQSGNLWVADQLNNRILEFKH